MYTLVSYGLNAVRAYVLVHVTMATVHISHLVGRTSVFAGTGLLAGRSTVVLAAYVLLDMATR